MRILLIGSTGFFGHHVGLEFDRLGMEWVGFDLSLGNDICNPTSFANLTGKFDVVVNLASMTFVPESYQNPYPFFHVNSEGTLNALEFCRKQQAKLIYISSYVYGVPKYSPIDENHPTDAFNPYCGSKIISENLCNYYNRFWEVPVVVLRPFNLYGFSQKSSFLIPQVVEQAMLGHIQVKETRPKRDYIYISDAVSAVIKSIQYQNKGFEIFNVGTGESHSVQEVIDIVSQRFDQVKVTSENSTRINEVFDTVADISKIKKELNWSPKVDLKTGLNTIIDKYLLDK